MREALIDFSSTGLSLLVMDDGKKPVFRLRRTLSVVDFMSRKGKLMDRGIDKVAEAVFHLKDAALEVGALRIYLIATASMRLIVNHDDVKDRILEKTGLSLSILSGSDEAYCTAAVNREYAEDCTALLLDIGGATCQIADLREPERDNMFSLPIGPMSLYKRLDDILPTKKEIKDMRRYIIDVLAGEMVYQGASYERIVLAGSTAEALLNIYADYYGRLDSDMKMMSRKMLKRLVDHLVGSGEGRSLILMNAPEKIHVLIPAAVLALTCAKYYDSDEFIYSEMGVKEGYLRILEENR